MPESFVHLRVHSDYTLSRGASKAKDLVAEAARLGMPALALADDGNMHGAYDVSGYASKAGVQPIVGAKLWMDLGEGRRGSLCLYARDEAGYVNLCSIVGASHRPRKGVTEGNEGILDLDVLERAAEGVIVLTGPRDGVLNTLLAGAKDGSDGGAGDILAWLRDVFRDRLYVEVCRHGDEDEAEVALEERLLDLAFSAPLLTADGEPLPPAPVVATSEVWYAAEGRHDAFEILRAVERKKSVAVQDGRVVATSARRFHMRSATEMRALFADLPEAFENASALARRCSFMVKGRKPILPPFECGGGRTEAEELRAQGREGLVRRLDKLKVPMDGRAPYEERLEFELSVIERMQFPGYFLIVSDFIKWAKANGIPVGPGRGSGAGSIVAYALEITDLEPMRFGLLFERFLNPDRVSMPDFDIDFCQDRREEVIRYVQEKYGTDFVSLIATFGEMKSKSALKDVGRVLMSDDFGGFGFYELNEIGKLMPLEGVMPKKLKDSYEDDGQPEFRHKVDSEPKYRVLYENALKVEGLYRNLSTHAAGVVIGGQPLQTLAPIGWDTQADMPVCQFNMKATESVGLVKFDFLGLKTLSVIREALAHVKETTGEDVDISAIPFDDDAAYRLLREGHTNNVFQLESPGMTKAVVGMRADCFEDIIALVALYRPGPMENIPVYNARKHGDQEVEIIHPLIEPILRETQGVIVYQEQVMQIAQVLSGYSLGEADLLRRAMGKKIRAEMDVQRVRFVDGCVKNDIPAKQADSIFDLLAKFADYGFNKSHAAAYALISYQTAWLKAHYPAQFMAAVLTYETDNAEKMARVKEDMDALGIAMLPPNVNESSPRFRCQVGPDGKLGIRFGLTAIKGISGELPLMVAERAKRRFRDVQDFHERAGSAFNKSQFERLSEAGAFDGLARNRYAAFNTLTWLSKGSKKAQQGPDLFGGELKALVPKDVADVAEWGNVVDREFNAVGFYFGSHPLDAYERRLIKARVKRKASLYNWMVQNATAQLKQKRLAGLVHIVERKHTKRGNKPYVWARVNEKNDSFDVSFFPDHDSPNPAGDVEEFIRTLENAKVGRRPVVVTADVVVQDGREGLTLWGRKVEDADELLADERGAMVVEMRPEAVILSLDEQREVRDAADAEKRGAAAKGSREEAEASVRARAYSRKVSEMCAYLATLRDDADAKAVEVAIKVVEGGAAEMVTLEGRYAIGVSQENAIKSTDGVTSVAERV